MPQHNHDNPLLKGSENLPEILAQQTTGNDPIPSLCPPANGKFIECSQEYARQQMQELARLGITRESMSTKEGVIGVSETFKQHPKLLNEPIFEIKNTNKDMQDFYGNEIFGKATTWDKWQLSSANKTAKKYDTVQGRKREKAARKSRKKNRK